MATAIPYLMVGPCLIIVVAPIMPSRIALGSVVSFALLDVLVY